MKNLKICDGIIAGWIGLMAVAGASLPATSAMGEETFKVLQVGTHLYTNVTVTSKASTYIFIIHAGGMQSIKVMDLPLEAARKLGYAPAEEPKPAVAAGTQPDARVQTGSPSAHSVQGNWATRAVAQLAQMPQFKALEQHLRQALDGKVSSSLRPPALPRKTAYVAMGIALALHLFLSYCFSLICRKAGQPSGILVWVPGLQWIALFRAADMSGWWFLACLVPGINLLALILWAVKIVGARGKSAWLAVLLLVPGINLLALLYLAFSSGGEAKEERRIEVMTLEAA